jgi:hypothetical protein
MTLPSTAFLLFAAPCDVICAHNPSQLLPTGTVMYTSTPLLHEENNRPNHHDGSSCGGRSLAPRLDRPCCFEHSFGHHKLFTDDKSIVVEIKMLLQDAWKLPHGKKEVLRKQSAPRCCSLLVVVLPSYLSFSM